jgi:hypothetical protein
MDNNLTILEYKQFNNFTVHHIGKRSNQNCGESIYSPDVTSLIAGGNQLKPGVWPFLAALFHHSKFICGGSIGILL